jgi:hypothetical protein
MEGNGFSRFFFRPEDLALPKDMDLTVPSLDELPPPPAFPDPLASDWTGGSSVVALNTRVEQAKAAADAWNAANPLPVDPVPEIPE